MSEPAGAPKPLRILFVTAYYPPCDYGWGYMTLCERVVDGLAARGHQVAVLTSTYRNGRESKPYPVYRNLPLDPDWHRRAPALWQFFVGRRRRGRESVRALKQVVRAFSPDFVFVWHGHGLSRRMLAEAEAMPGVRVAYYFANYLPELPDEYEAYWKASPVRRAPASWAKRLLAPLALRMLRAEGKPIRLRYERSISASRHVRDRLLGQGLIGEDAALVHNGVDLSRFRPAVAGPRRFRRRPLRCLMAGRLAPEKGVHTVLEALARMRRMGCLDQVQVTLQGDGPLVYRRQLEQMVIDYGLRQVVQFRAPVPPEAMSDVLAGYEVLLFPSIWEEPFATVVLEAMAVGLLVIGTTRGGTAEVLCHGETGLVFEAEDPAGLARRLVATLADPEGAACLASNGQRVVQERYSAEQLVLGTERHLLRWAGEAA